MPGRSIAIWISARRSPIPRPSPGSRIAAWICDIGTAKPDPETLARVPHCGLDLVDPGERYSAGRFARDAAAWIAAVRAAHRQPVVVGGTGLYIRALAEGLFREPPFDPDRRAQLRRWSESLEGADLARWAGRLDPQFLGGGRQRAARAVEVALLTGHALSWWQREAREGATLSPPRVSIRCWRRDSSAKCSGNWTPGLPRTHLGSTGSGIGRW